MRKTVHHWLRRWALASTCVLAPLILGVYGTHFFSDRLNEGKTLCAITRQLSFSLLGEASPSPRRLSPELQRRCDQVAGPGSPVSLVVAGTAGAQPAVAEPGEKVPPKGGSRAASADEIPPPPQLSLIANHIAGRVNVAYSYAFLALVSAVAFVFGSFVIVRYSNAAVWLGVVVMFSLVTWFIASIDAQGEDIRAIVADNILARADADQLLKFMPAAENLKSLIWLGLWIGYLSVSIILASLFFTSVRWVERSSLEGLKERMWFIRASLILGSAILVVVVFSSRAVFDWPLSLLQAPDQKALKPAADALVHKWGAIGSISLIGAFLPAIAAWYLDREAYRSVPQPPRVKEEAQPDAGELEIAPLGLITSIVAALAPVIASPLFDAFKSLAAAMQK
jgi:hypothetical protein